MALTKGKSVSPEVLRVAKETVDRIPQKDLLFYAATSPSFSGGGFRKDNVVVVRSRIGAMIGSAEPIDDSLRALLVRFSECASIVSKLSRKTVSDNLQPFSSLFGYHEFAFALSLDETMADVLEQHERGAVPPSTGDEDRERALQAIRGELSVLAKVCGETTVDFDSARRIKELQNELSALKGTAKRLEKSESARTAAETELTRLKSRAEEAERQEGQWRQRAERAEAELARNVRDADMHVQSLLDTRLAEEFSDWLGVRRAALVAEIAKMPLEGCGGVPLCAQGNVVSPDADLSRAGDGDDLQRRALAAIQHQASADLVSGSRYVLERRCAVYDELYRRAVTMLGDALAPIGELASVRDELKAESERIRRLLGQGDEPPAASPEELLAAAMATASDHELPDLVHTAYKLQSLGIVSGAAAQRLKDSANRRYSAIYARRGGPGLDNGDPNSTECVLRHALSGDGPLVLLIDAHNTLFALQSRYCRPQDHRGPSAAARDWLIEDVARIFSNAHNCRVIMVFDGPERTESMHSGNVKVVYSGGGGSNVEHRADDVIVDEARFISEASRGCRMLLMTNDNGLSSRAASYGARNVAPTALLEYLR